MFPRLKKCKSGGKQYEYLVISETVYKKGKGVTTEDIAHLGNIQKFKREDIESIIEGFIKIFQLETYSVSEDVEIIESLEHGSVIFWKEIWKRLGLSKIITTQLKRRKKRIELEVDKYIEMMTINRCVNPLSKLAVTRWIQSTSYKEMNEFSDLDMDVTYFYRSMDYLLKIKDKVEFEIFKKLRNLFSVNVKLTFYDITSTYFYSDRCPLCAEGYSRDNRPDKKQIVIGAVTSQEGYPIKHYVFMGNTKDEKTVEEEVNKLKKEYTIEETTFVGDRGMITKLNLKKIVDNGFDYIMGVKARQDEICGMLFSDEEIGNSIFEEHNDLQIREKKVRVKDFLLWKIKEIVKTQQEEIKETEFKSLEIAIQKLSNQDEVKYKRFKTLIMSNLERDNNKISYQIFNFIKKYSGKYENELRYVICLNGEIKQSVKKTRTEQIKKLSGELRKIFSLSNKKKEMIEIEKSINKVFDGYRSRYKKFFQINRDEKTKKAISYTENQDMIKREERMDGIFVLLTSRSDLQISKVVDSYKNLKEVETLFYDLKNFVDIRPVRHWLEQRVRAHVFICFLSLLLKRVFEIHHLKGKSVSEPLEEIEKVKLIKYKVKFTKKENRSKEFFKVTHISPDQKKYFDIIGIKNPMSLENFYGGK